MMWRTQTGGSEGRGPLSGQNLHFLKGSPLAIGPAPVCSEQLHSRARANKRVSKHNEGPETLRLILLLAAAPFEPKSLLSPNWVMALVARPWATKGTEIQSGLRPYPAVPKEQLGFPILKKKNYLKRNSTNTNLTIHSTYGEGRGSF